MRKGKFDRTRWEKARALAEQGVPLTEACRKIKIHHATGIYISRQMGFKWPSIRDSRRRRSEKPETVGRVERMMRLVGL